MDMKKSRKKADIHEKRARRIRQAIKITATAIAVLAAVFAVVFVIFINTGDWANIDPAKLEAVKQTVTLYDTNGRPMASVYSENRVYIPLEDIPQDAIDALLYTEDSQFYRHNGINVVRIASALWANIKSGRKAQGASTITQQLAKNVYLTNEKTWTRKIKEAWLSLQLERYYSKDEILELYLNYVYFGNGAYGIEAAAQSYFGIPASEMTLAQSAQVIGILKGTGIYAPHLDMTKSLTRRDLILTILQRENVITEQEMAAAQAEACVLDLSKPGRSEYGFFVDAAINEVLRLTGQDYETMIASGYSIYTTMDPAVQSACEAAVANPDYFPPNASDGSMAQTAMVVLDGQTGQVRALIGARNYEVERGLNRAVQSKRQPGSAIKPLMVYAPALEYAGYTPVCIIDDQPTDFGGYKPGNAGDSYHGQVTLRESLYRSLNVPAVAVLDDIGIATGREFCENLDIPFALDDNNLSLALGGFTNGVSPLELAQAYTVFSAGGVYTPATMITRIEDSEGRAVYTNSTKGKQVLSQETAFIMTDMMRDTVEQGTAKRLREANIPLAAKTGTVAYNQGNSDAWLAAYNNDYVLVSWMGFDYTDTQHCLPGGATGGNYNARLATDVLKQLYAARTAPGFTQPDTVVHLAIDRQALWERRELLLASALTPADEVIEDYFLRDRAPTDTAGTWNAPAAATRLEVTLQQDKPVVRFTAPQAGMRCDIYRHTATGSEVVQSIIAKSAQETLQYSDRSAPAGPCGYTVVCVNPNLDISSTPTAEITVTVP